MRIAAAAATTTLVDPCAAPARTASPDPLMIAARGQSGVASWSAVPYLCDRLRCHSVVGGLPVYGDPNHLLQYVARTSAKAQSPR